MKVLVIEDHPIVIQGCRALFAEDTDVTMIEARTAAAGRALYASENPEIVVVDINLPDGSGLELTGEILAKDPHAKIVVFSMSDAPVLAIQALEIGARGYVSKNGDPMSLHNAVRALARGEKWLPDDLVQEMALLRAGASGSTPVLSERELLILRALVRGRSMAEIASDIEVSYKTVAADCSAIRTKLNARTSSEMVRIAVELRIV
ncbi:MAG: DNA-binding response regulator [Hyphomicrobium sp.]|nr:MAG: DNA-binding response regulator [Hyphomicrobium sp.]PPD00028.1 MAG: DNA-binding response regulator [Hyphomicrobium sp.]